MKLKKFSEILNNKEGSIITIEDIIKAIKADKYIFVELVSDFKNHNPDEAVKPVSVDNNGLITVLSPQSTDFLYTDIKNVISVS